MWVCVGVLFQRYMTNAWRAWAVTVYKHLQYRIYFCSFFVLRFKKAHILPNYRLKKIIGKNDFPYHFKKIIVYYKKIGYNLNVIRQTACLVVNPVKVNSFAYLFNCTTVGRTSD